MTSRTDCCRKLAEILDRFIAQADETQRQTPLFAMVEKIGFMSNIPPQLLAYMLPEKEHLQNLVMALEGKLSDLDLIGIPAGTLTTEQKAEILVGLRAAATSEAAVELAAVLNDILATY